MNAADAIGIRGLIVHALDASAKASYERLGFDPWAHEANCVTPHSIRRNSMQHILML